MVSPLFTAFALIAAGQADSAAAPAADASTQATQESYVPNVRSEGVAEWEADGERGIHIMSQDGRWYYARTAAPCPRLRSAMSLGFDTRGPDRLDRHGAVIAEGWRCQLESVVRSAGPDRGPREG